MAGGTAWSRRVAARVRSLRGLVRDTQKALTEQAEVITDPEISIRVQEIDDLASRCPALVILGNTSSARARLLHCLLGQPLLPPDVPDHCPWLRIQYGSTTQVHLTLSNSEFELVEELQCNMQPWETLPVEDLTRQYDSYPSTMLEIELNIPFLKDGIKIIVPPDIIDSGSHNYRYLKETHAELYTKREEILKKYNCIYLYAIDEIGKSIFSDNIGGVRCSVSEDDFWSKFSLYDLGGREEKKVVREEMEWKESGVPAVLTGVNCLDLHQIKEIDSNAQVFFLLFSDSREEKIEEQKMQSDATESGDAFEELPEADQGIVKGGLRHTTDSPEHRSLEYTRLNESQTAFMNELLDQWDLMFSAPPKYLVKSQYAILDDVEIRKNPQSTDKEGATIRSKTALIDSVLKFAAESVKTFLLQCCTKLSEIHVRQLQQFILSSFSLARELQLLPKKIQYVAAQEELLYKTINEKFTAGENRQQMVQLMQEVLTDMKTEIHCMDWSVDDLPWHQDPRFTVSASLSTRAATPPDASDVEEATDVYESYSFDDYDIIDDDSSLSVSYAIRPSEESSPAPGASRASACAGRCRVSVKRASLDVQRTVLSKLSRKVSQKLVNFVDCLKDSYFGTLQRCLASLEQSCRHELGGRPASEAMRLLLSVARQVDLQPQASFSTMRSIMDSFRRLLCRLRLAGDAAEAGCCALSPAWRRHVASTTVQSLNAHTICRIISTQILERLTEAHSRFQAALAALQAALASRLHHTEHVKLAIRKQHAPCFARLCLESTSMCDLLKYKTPELGREIGRGQYGVVYAARGGWAGRAPVCVKSVLPADERHCRELAMEFFYTRSIPAHPRIVRLFGSIVVGAGRAAPRVLLVSRRYARDLHAAVRAGAASRTRMMISADIVEGIRYLHSLGLVHRDIKMKNVLLDERDRAALSDLGFCSAEALISGSVVGTPVHMAPELLAGEYDANVDIYAFGILFWYVCAGNIKLPSAFEAFQNKEQLWSKVKRGLRPERLPHFTDECWDIMQSCWASEPQKRALLGDVQLRLANIIESTPLEGEEEGAREGAVEEGDSDDSLDMTGIDRDL